MGVLLLGCVAGAGAAHGAVSGSSYRVDPGFSTNLERRGDGKEGSVNCLAAAPGGGFYAGGYFSTIGGQRHSSLARIKSDGTVDASFNIGGIGFDSDVNTVAVQADGKIVVGGQFMTFNGTACGSIVRLNADGTLDTTFNPSGTGFDNGNVNSVAVQADGKILVGGYFSKFDGTTCSGGIARLNVDGTLDTAFNPSGAGFNSTVYSVAVQADGKILAGGYFSTFNGTTCSGRVARLKADGTLDTTFNPSGTGFDSSVYSVAVQADGKIIVGGWFSAFNGTTCSSSIARLNADGTLDTAFNSSGTGFDSDVASLAVQTDGKIMVGGWFGTFNGATCSGGLVRLNTDGSLDTAFNPSGTGFDGGANTLLVLADGGIEVGGSYSLFNDEPSVALTRLTAAGAVASAMPADDFRVPANAERVVPLAGGKFLVSGPFSYVNGATCGGIARLNADGTFDTTFNPSGTGFNSDVTSLAVQADGKIVVGGWFSTFNGTTCGTGIARLNADGTLDTTFNPSGTGFNSDVTSLAVQADGKIIVGGWFSKFNDTTCGSSIARLNADGTLDVDFNPSGAGFNSSVYALAVQADGKIVAGGDFQMFNGTTCSGKVARLNADGTLDADFNPSGTGFDGNVTSLAVQPDGKIVAGGYFGTYDGTDCSGNIARLNADGTLDTGFNPSGIGFDGSVQSVSLQSDGKILVGGWFTAFNGQPYGNGSIGRMRVASIFSFAMRISRGFGGCVARLNTDGTLDSSFSLVSSTMGEVNSLVACSDGRLLLAGPSAYYNGVLQAGLVVLKPDVAPVFTSQPTSVTVTVGSNVIFIVEATGSPAPTYQWYKGTTLLTGKTSATLILSNVQMADADRYTVVATSGASTTTSNAAVMSVTVPTSTSGGGGGGAPSLLYLVALSAAALARYVRRRN